MRVKRGPLPAYPSELIEAPTLAAANCQRQVYARVDETAVPAEARRLADELLALAGDAQPVVALALGFEFDRRRLRADELLRRLIAAVLLSHLGARDIFASPVSYQGRARWDLYAPELETLVALNHLVDEAEVLQHLVHHHARTVLWGPATTDRRAPEGWYLLRYTALQPWPPARNWFDEVVRGNERQSAERRALSVSARGMEGRVATARAILGQIYAALDAGEYLTLAEEV